MSLLSAGLQQRCSMTMQGIGFMILSCGNRTTSSAAAVWVWGLELACDVGAQHEPGAAMQSCSQQLHLETSAAVLSIHMWQHCSAGLAWASKFWPCIVITLSIDL